MSLVTLFALTVFLSGVVFGYAMTASKAEGPAWLIFKMSLVSSPVLCVPLWVSGKMSDELLGLVQLLTIAASISTLGHQVIRSLHRPRVRRRLSGGLLRVAVISSIVFVAAAAQLFFLVPR